MRKLLIMGLLATLGCGAAAPSAPTARLLVSEERRPEARPLPPDPATEPFPEGTPATPPEDYVEAVEVGQPVPASGILVSEARAVRDAMYRMRYPELRQFYRADRQVWVAQRDLYEAQIQVQREEIERLQPSWWEKNDGAILATVGVVAGVAVTVLITYAVNQAGE